MNQLQYVIECWDYGWVLCSPGYRPGIPITALSESLKLFPKGAIMDSGIAHHLEYSGRRNTVTVICTQANSRKWRQEITDALKGGDPEDGWWRGVDVGKSSAAIFAVFCGKQWLYDAREFSEGATPSDAGDFGQCHRLLQLFPEWRKQISAVGVAYPDTAWPEIVLRWEELEQAPPEKVREILHAIHEEWRNKANATR